MVEVMVAILVLMLATLATFGLLSAAARNTDRAKGTQVALDMAQKEMEKLRSLTDEERALTAMPLHSTNPLDPDYRVNFATKEFALTREPRERYEPLVYNGGSIYNSEELISGGTIEPGPTPFTSGDVSGEVYRYVVWRNDTACGEACAGPQDYKQVIVAVKLDKQANQSAERAYVEVQSDFVDPAKDAETAGLPGPSKKSVTAQQFFLSDTPCSATGSTERESWTVREETGDHLLHDTLGVCSDGLHTGTIHGAPDALLLGPPPDPDPSNSLNPPLYDYSNDYYLGTNPDTAKGVQIPPDSTNGCHYEPTGTTHPESQVHRWVSDPMAAEFTLTGNVTIEFYTRSLNDDLYHGTLCVYLFDRHESGSEPEDTRYKNMNGETEYWTYTPEGNEYWPRGAWTKVRMKMALITPQPIATGDRLGVALSAERNNTPPESALPIMYDDPDRPTRIEVDTSTPIQGG
jgi:hypothetical protein